jgi:hypothetical protein
MGKPSSIAPQDTIARRFRKKFGMGIKMVTPGAAGKIFGFVVLNRPVSIEHMASGKETSPQGTVICCHHGKWYPQTTADNLVLAG